VRRDCKEKSRGFATEAGSIAEVARSGRAKMRLLHYSKRTESAYIDWMTRFILFNNKRHPHEMGAAEFEASRLNAGLDSGWMKSCNRYLSTDSDRFAECLNALYFMQSLR